MKNSKIKFYILFFVFAIIINTLIETMIIQFGIVNYTVEPKFLGIAWFTYLLYFPWILITYSGGNFLSEKTKIHKYLFYFIIGAFFAFCFDLYFTSANLYFYKFNTIFSIGRVPIEDFFAVGLMMTFSVVISDYLTKKIINI
jgi:hypothetical protein